MHIEFDDSRQIEVAVFVRYLLPALLGQLIPMSFLHALHAQQRGKRLEHFESLDVCNELVDRHHYVIISFHLAFFGLVFLVDLFALVERCFVVQGFLFDLFAAELVPGLKHPLVVVDFPVARSDPHRLLDVEILDDFADGLVGHGHRKHVFLFVDVGCLVARKLQQLV